MDLLTLLENEPVEWKKLGDVCTFPRGNTISKKETVVGNIPVIGGGQKPAYYHNQSNREQNTIAVAGSGAYAGFVSYWEKPIFLSDAFSVEPNETLNKKYVYHWLLQQQHKIYELKQGSGVPHVYGRDLGKFKIPIPSIEIQEKIVKTLDKFTEYVNELQTELQTELQKRIDQYTYYRDTLLSEEYIQKLCKEMESDKILNMTRLDEVVVIKNGKDWKDLGEGDIPVYGSGGYMGVCVDRYAYDKPTVLIPRKGSIDNVFYLETPFWNVDTVFYTEINIEKLIPKYFYYFVEHYDLSRLSENPTRPSLTQSQLNKLIIPLPSLSLQHKIVTILDKFQTMIADAKGLLPREIEQRQQQYEYYREKLLTFSSECDSTHARTLIISDDYYRVLREVAKIADVDIEDRVYEKSLGDVGTFINGTGMPKTMFEEDGTIPAIHYGHIYTTYNIFVDTPIVSVSNANAERLRKIQYGDIAIAKTSENIDDVMKSVAYLGRTVGVIGGHAAIFRHNENPKYLSYVFNGYKNLIKQKNKLARGVKVIEISTTDMAKIKIPIPPLHVQQRIVSILDTFHTLVHDMQEGLPKEIKLRQQQYEYYRERLLSFPKASQG